MASFQIIYNSARDINNDNSNKDYLFIGVRPVISKNSKFVTSYGKNILSVFDTPLLLNNIPGLDTGIHKDNGYMMSAYEEDYGSDDEYGEYLTRLNELTDSKLSTHIGNLSLKGQSANNFGKDIAYSITRYIMDSATIKDKAKTFEEKFKKQIAKTTNDLNQGINDLETKINNKINLINEEIKKITNEFKKTHVSKPDFNKRISELQVQTNDAIAKRKKEMEILNKRINSEHDQLIQNVNKYILNNNIVQVDKYKKLLKKEIKDQKEYIKSTTAKIVNDLTSWTNKITNLSTKYDEIKKSVDRLTIKVKELILKSNLNEKKINELILKNKDLLSKNKDLEKIIADLQRKMKELDKKTNIKIDQIKKQLIEQIHKDLNMVRIESGTPAYYKTNLDSSHLNKDTVILVYRDSIKKQDISIIFNLSKKFPNGMISYTVTNNWVLNYIPSKKSFLIISPFDTLIKSVSFERK